MTTATEIKGPHKETHLQLHPSSALIDMVRCKGPRLLKEEHWVVDALLHLTLCDGNLLVLSSLQEKPEQRRKKQKVMRMIINRTRHVKIDSEGFKSKPPHLIENTK